MEATGQQIFWIDGDDVDFPPLESAWCEPNGLLAAGGDLNSKRLLKAYSQGIFPWYEENQPILWWSPDPRLIIRPEKIKVSRSLRKLLNSDKYQISVDLDFANVIDACSESRREVSGTWITAEMKSAYVELHEQGYCHSVEVWSSKGELAGGLYGLAIGQAFFGESMFSREKNTSKLALVFLARQLTAWGFKLIDCQVYSEHLVSLGAEEITRANFKGELDLHVNSKSAAHNWPSDGVRKFSDYEF